MSSLPYFGGKEIKYKGHDVLKPKQSCPCTSSANGFLFEHPLLGEIIVSDYGNSAMTSTILAVNSAKKLGAERKAVENSVLKDNSVCIDFDFKYDGSDMKFHLYEEKNRVWGGSGIYGSRFEMFSYHDSDVFAIKAESDKGFELHVEPRVGKETSFLNILEASINGFKKLPKLEAKKI